VALYQRAIREIQKLPISLRHYQSLVKKIQTMSKKSKRALETALQAYAAIATKPCEKGVTGARLDDGKTPGF
jgi:hypothetical protein